MKRYCNNCSMEIKPFEGQVRSCTPCRKQKRAKVNKANKEKHKAALSGKLVTPGKPQWTYHYQRYKYSAAKRSINFSLEPEEFASFWQKPCHYCDASISTIGLDRYDSSEGYYLDNVVPCCTECNLMKRSSHGQDFLRKCSRIHRKHNPDTL